MIRMLLVGYCYGIRHERRLCQEVALHLANRWFCKLNLDDKVPHHSKAHFRNSTTSRELDGDSPSGHPAPKARQSEAAAILVPADTSLLPRSVQPICPRAWSTNGGAPLAATPGPRLLIPAWAPRRQLNEPLASLLLGKGSAAVN
jgi:hypothetical protein